MRTLIIISSILVLSISITIKTQPIINSFEITEKYHSFAYYDNILSMILNINSYKKIILIPLDPHTNNYVGNPSTIQFAKYLAKCVIDTSYMDINKYNNFIKN